MTASLQPLEPRTLFAVTGLPFKLGSSTLDEGTKITYLPNGGYVVAGLFGGTVDFDPSSKVFNLTSVGDSDLFVAEYTASSQLVWADRFGGDGKDGSLHDQKKAIDIAADPSRGGGDFVNGFGDAPLDAGEYLNDLKIGPDGGVFLAGDFVEQFDADPGSKVDLFRTPRSGYYNGFIVKLNPSTGALDWAQNIGGEFTDTVSALAFQSNGDVVATGLFSRDVDFTVAGSVKHLEAQGRADGYVMSLSSKGSIDWIAQFGSDETDRADRESGNDLAIDSAGNIYVVGAYAGNAVFTGTSSTTLELDADKHADGFLAKYTAAGRIRSALSFGGGGYDALTHVAITDGGSTNGNIVVSGYFSGDNFDADPTAHQHLLATSDDSGDSKYRTDAVIEEIRGGQLRWAQQLTGDGTEFIDGLTVTSNNSIIAVGSYYDTAQFGSNGPTLTSERGTHNFHDNNDNGRDYSYDAFAWGLRFDGATTAVKTFGSSDDDFGMGLSVSGPSLLLTGRFQDEVDFDPTTAQRKLTAFGFGDVFIDQISATVFESQVAYKV